MALKLFHLISFIFLIFILLAPISHAKRKTPRDKNTSPFDFIKKLEGCHKGNNTKGIHWLKAFLEKFGYLEYLNNTLANNDVFDESLESAIKTYQQYYHVKPTGILDTETVAKMVAPRCGVPDIVKKHDPSSSSIHAEVSKGPKWPPTKTHLTYLLSPNFPADAVAPVACAFQKWESKTHFSFSRVESNADLVIGFHRGNHSDGFPFDGRGGTLAHAFPPTNGRFHYDIDEPWSVGAVAGAFDLETVAVHEIGHLLGLGHSSVEAAVMFGKIDAGQTKDLLEVDIQMYRDLYNA